MTPGDLDSALGKVRELSAAYQSGRPESFAAFRDLAQMLLGCTVLADGQHVRLTGRRSSGGDLALGGTGGPTDPVKLRDGRWLRVSVSLYRDTDDERGPLLKVRQSSFQYQTDRPGDDWAFRYDYLRQRQQDPHPTAHLQIRGTLTEQVLGSGQTLERVHFPTGRISIEAVIRLLVEQFHVPTKADAAWWRPVLTVSEKIFHDIAHRPESGPPR
jgi:hypothetical protein